MMASMELAGDDAGLPKERQGGASRNPLAAITNQARMASSVVSKLPADSLLPSGSQSSLEVATVVCDVDKGDTHGNAQDEQGGSWKNDLSCSCGESMPTIVCYWASN